MIRNCSLSLLLLVLVACRAPINEVTVSVSLLADGRTQTFTYVSNVSVEELLANAKIVLGELDRVSHPLSLQLADGMLVTVRRVREEQVCQRESLPFQRQLIPYEGIAAGEQKLSQAGRSGLQEACYRTVLENDVESQRIPIGQPTILTEPRDEIVIVGPAQSVEPYEFSGRLSYINNGIAWTIRDDAVNKRPLRRTERLDSLVFAPSADSSHLLYTVSSEPTEKFFNELWMISVDGDEAPIKLAPTDVLYAEWRPRTSNTIAYSTGERGQGQAPWKSLNNLWLMRISRQTGRTLSIQEIIGEHEGGPFGWWGTDFAWSPRGDRLAWVDAEAVGVVEIEEKQRVTLLEYSAFNTSGSWVWLSQLSWSQDGNLVSVTAHGAPLANEPAGTSPVFDLAVLGANGEFKATMIQAVGMWAAPTFSPNPAVPDAERSEGYLAWLKAREPYNSIYGEYDLVVADRDGSNQRVIFPRADQPGIRRSDFGLTATDMSWSPDSRHIAIVYLGDIWLVEIESGEGHRITFDGGASNPVWAR